MHQNPGPNHKVVQLRRGSTLQNDGLIGAEGEVTIDLSKKTAVVHDGHQLGGFPLRRDDAMFNRQYFTSFKAAVVQGGVAFLGLATKDNGPIPTIIPNIQYAIATARFDPFVEQRVEGSFTMPFNWVSTPIVCNILWRCTNIQFPVVWKLEIGGISDGGIIEDFEFQGVHTFPPVDHAVPNELLTSTLIIQAADIPNVLASGEVFFRFGRGSDSVPESAELFTIRFDVERYSL